MSTPKLTIIEQELRDVLDETLKLVGPAYIGTISQRLLKRITLVLAKTEGLE